MRRGRSAAGLMGDWVVYHADPPGAMKFVVIWGVGGASAVEAVEAHSRHWPKRHLLLFSEHMIQIVVLQLDRYQRFT